MRLRYIFILLLLPALSACSLYESEGRKFLERNLSSIGVTVQANLTACNRMNPSHDWALLERRADTTVFASENSGYQLRVVPLEDSSFNCYFSFASAQELYEKVPAASERTLFELQYPAPKASE